MNFFESLLPAWMILAIIVVVGVTEYIKKADQKNRLKKFYIWIPVVFSFGAGAVLVLAGLMVWKEYPFYVAVIFSFATLAYNQIIERFKKKNG